MLRRSSRTGRTPAAKDVSSEDSPSKSRSIASGAAGGDSQAAPSTALRRSTRKKASNDENQSPTLGQPAATPATRKTGGRRAGTGSKSVATHGGDDEAVITRLVRACAREEQGTERVGGAWMDLSAYVEQDCADLHSLVTDCTTELLRNVIVLSLNMCL